MVISPVPFIAPATSTLPPILAPLVISTLSDVVVPTTCNSLVGVAVPIPTLSVSVDVV